jgi:hypothetical protein
MQQIDNIINYFIELDTEQLIKDIACEMLANEDLVTTFPKCVGIMILATQDAKTEKESSSNNELYIEIYDNVKRLLDAKDNNNDNKNL